MELDVNESIEFMKRLLNVMEWVDENVPGIPEAPAVQKLRQALQKQLQGEHTHLPDAIPIILTGA